MAIKVIILLPFVLTACEKAVLPDAVNTPNKTGNVTLSFTTTNQDATRASTMSMYITKLNVQLFDENGQKVFSTVKTQTKDDENFGTLSVELAEGTYTAPDKRGTALMQGARNTERGNRLWTVALRS